MAALGLALISKIMGLAEEHRKSPPLSGQTLCYALPSTTCSFEELLSLCVFYDRHPHLS